MIDPLVEGALRACRSAPFAVRQHPTGPMMKLKLFLALSATAIAMPVTAAIAQPAPATAAAESAHDRLFRLFKESDEANLKRNPINALFRGDLRYADRLGDNITD